MPHSRSQEPPIMNHPKVYLAGPAVFRPDAAEIGRRLQAQCERAGLVGLWPLDNDVSGATPLAQAQAIYRGNMQMIRAADALIADISPFRGPHMDCGTAFEIGAAAALGKPIFAYTNDQTTVDAAPVPSSMMARIESAPATGGRRDRNGDLVEDFGLAENLMIGCAAAVVALTVEDAIAACVEALRRTG